MDSFVECNAAGKDGGGAPAQTETAAPTKASGILTLANINPQILEMQYAVRGEVPILANKIRDELAAGTGAWPFNEVIQCNIGNPQACGK